MTLFKVRVGKPEAYDPHIKEGQFEYLEILSRKYLHILGPGFLFVRRSGHKWVMVPGSYENADRIQRRELPLDEFNGVLRYLIGFKKITGDKNEINLRATGIVRDAAKSPSDGLSFSVAEPRGKA